jgi:hypothetical protein
MSGEENEAIETVETDAINPLELHLKRHPL